ncbi:hypothetical protein Back11_00060 [Paenibacillus baekrokdamisoli]|uniref:Uncharacterized protein n=1 Tax=Paenibacillus baekrokdamisoli TaxID=1712516 RepID=A0A3G9IYB2_9BACL|nr:DUF5696 domain-containing protein [Paenibacillus baekrokdamisoli]MBB3069371.1 hypothetical protein [Paenibacillus baekrokdamisoli]BBH18661.1 hypothetical protein Back11_00060 [Paenibacillus baekrokdamisoli]
MSRMRKYAFLFVVAALCMPVFLSEQALANTAGKQHFEKTAENGKFALYVNMSDGQFAVEQKSSGFRWWSNPPEREDDPLAKGVFKMQLNSQLLVTYATSKGETSMVNNFVASINEKGAAVEKTKRGFRAVYRFPKQDFVIPVEYTLEPDHLKAEIITGEIRENDPDTKITQIAFLPYFGAGSTADNGYLFVPDGSGALIRFNNGKSGYDAYRQKIYDNDNVLSQTREIIVRQRASLPVFGLKNKEHAFVAVIDKGDSLGTVRASVSGMGTSYNQVFSEFTYRQLDTAQLLSRTWAEKEVNLLAGEATKLDRITLDYYFLDGEKSDYSGMAQRYQQFLIEEKGLQKSVMAGQTPLYLDLFGAIAKKKSFFGIPFTSMEPLTTFKQAEQIIGQLQQSGVEHIVLRYKGWANDGLTNKTIPSTVKAISRLGGTTGYKRLLDYVDKQRVEFYPDVDLVHFQESGNGFSSHFDAANAVTKLVAPQYAFLRSTYQINSKEAPQYLLSPLKMQGAVDKFAQSYARFDHPNVSLNELGMQVYSDYRKNGIDRGTSVGIWTAIFEGFKARSARLMLNQPNGYALPYAVHVTQVPFESSRFDIEDESVPFYQLVLHGIVPYSAPSVNLSSDPDYIKLKAIETGSYLQYSWMHAETASVKETPYDYLYSTHYRDWMDSAVAGYKELHQILYKVADRRMVGHQQLGQGVYETTYENGIRIIVNYNEHAVNVRGQSVERMGYLVLDGVEAR